MKKNIIFLALICVTILISCGSVAADQTVIPSNADSNLTVSNEAGARFDTIGNESYNFFNSSSQSATQGQNALHITTSNTNTAGNVTFTTAQSGTFYISDTGGRGWDDNGILMLAINGTIPDNFYVTITASGYQWTPVFYTLMPNSTDLTYVLGAVNETFTKEDFLYGPQIWKPSPMYNNPIFSGQNMDDTENKFNIMFIDLWAGIIGTGASYYNTLIDNGMIKIDYTFNNLPEGSLATFNAYAYCQTSKQGEGVRWTNRVTGSGYHVTGISALPVADFSADVTSGTVPLTVHFTDNSNGSEPLTYAWDFNNDGIVDSTEQNPVYTYNTPGTYTVKLTITNIAGSNEKTITIRTSDEDIVAPTPSADLPSGSYNTDQTVNLSATDDWDANPEIYYTLDETDPTTSSTLYTGSISLNSEATTTLKFIAVDDTGNISNIFTKTYTIDKTAPTVTVNPVGDTYNTVQNVTLTATDANSTTTYYTIDGSDPRTSSTRIKYTGSISINTTTTLGFAAVDAAGNWSPFYNETYNMVDINAPVPYADLPEGLYDSDKTVKLGAVDELDPNPKIYYTLDGTNPTTNSTLYTWPISINLVGTTILKFIAVDAAGHTSDVYTKIYLLDKPGASGTWSSVTLDTNSMYNSVAVDSSGNVHIVYYQKADSATEYPELKYAYNDSTGWHIETLESTQSGSGYYVSLVLDSLSYPRIAYSTSTPDKLRYAYKDATGWHFLDLVLNTDVSYINMLLYNDLPRISYFENTEERLKYIYYDGINWFSEYVTPTKTSGHWNSLALNSHGNPRICYYDIDNEPIASLKYAKRTPTGEWQISVVDASANVGSWCSIVIDSTDSPHISYTVNNINGGALKYAYWSETQWIIETVDNLKTVASKLVLDQFGNPRIIYQDVVSGNLKYAYKEGSNWFITNIDTVDGAGHWLSLTMSPSGIPHVSYMSSNSLLKHAYLVPFTVSADPNGGVYELAQTVNLTSTSGTTIYYTTDGTDPRISSTKIKYIAPIPVRSAMTIKFAAVDSANNWSSICTETYTINTVSPIVSAAPAGGNYDVQQNVTLITFDPDSPTTTYYTLDGSDPTTNSSVYTVPIAINVNTVLKFFAVDATGNTSPIYSETYNISQNPMTTPDGRYIVFQSAEADLVSGVNNGYINIFVKDNKTGQLVWISRGLSGAQANGNSYNPQITSNGRYIIFESDASNLVANDTNGFRDIFVVDGWFMNTILISGINGTSTNGNSYNPQITSDARYIVFESDATNLVSNDSNNCRDIFVVDGWNSKTIKISGINGTQTDGNSYNAQITPNARYITFESDATNLVSNDSNGFRDIFVVDGWYANTVKISGMNGVQANGDSYNAQLTPDARYIIFESDATNLVANDINGFRDIFVVDGWYANTIKISGMNGIQSNGDSYNAQLTPNARYITFESNASNLVSNDTNDYRDVFVVDGWYANTIKISGKSGSPANGSSYNPQITSDGRYINFESDASNLVSNDTDGFSDYFRTDGWNSKTVNQNI